MLINCEDRSKNIIEEYNKYNKKIKKKLIYHVGTEAGLFSELNNMLIAICWCYINNVQFTLYADDANFAGENGWTDFFIEFCPMNHDRFNRKGNYRHKWHFRYKRILLPNLLFRRFLYPQFIKKRNNVEYLTQDIFEIITSTGFLDSTIEWKMFGINGKVKEEFAKLSVLAMNYTPNIEKEIIFRIKGLDLPDRYASIQIRGGDKIYEYECLYDVDYCMRYLKEWIENIDALFVFTDNYINYQRIVEKIKSSVRVITLTYPNERGYYNEDFNAYSWDYRRDNLIKLLSMVETCLMSRVHCGYSGTCTDDFIRSIKPADKYIDMNTNSCIRNKSISYYVRKFLKFR